MFGASSELANVMEFGFYWDTAQFVLYSSIVYINNVIVCYKMCSCLVYNLI